MSDRDEPHTETVSTATSGAVGIPASTPSVCVAIVDYDNACTTREQTIGDTESNLTLLFNTAVRIVEQLYPDIPEVSLRLYGGWTLPSGRLTQRGEWLLVTASRIPRRIRGKRVIPYLVNSLARIPSVRLLGTYRTVPRPPRQKMVDTTIVLDLQFFAERLVGPLLMLSDDDDVLPGTLTARTYTEHITLARSRPVGEGINDSAAIAFGLRIIQISAEVPGGV